MPLTFQSVFVPFTLKGLCFSLQAVHLVSLHHSLLPFPFLTECPLSGFSKAVIPCQPLRQHSLHAFQHGAKCICWMLLSKVLCGITRAYKCGSDGPLGVKPLTLKDLVVHCAEFGSIYNFFLF